jgi:nucleoside-diphosphate-sugar epimerase
MDAASRQVVLIGNTGFLGRAIELQVGSSQDQHVSLAVPDHRALVAGLLNRHCGADTVSSYLNPALRQDFIFSVGIANPHRNEAELDRINVEVPLRLLEHLCGASYRDRLRLITFGTVLAVHPQLAELNPYYRSKSRLLQAWKERSRSCPIGWVHVHLHTLYGGPKPPHPFMFTGQMLSALRSGSVFEMSSGMQLREYHHVDDIAKSLLSFLALERNEPHLLELSSGDPLRLRDLAKTVFDHFGARNLLSIGARTDGDAEVFENRYRRSMRLIAYRDPCAGVIAWFEKLGVGRESD